MKDKKIPLNKEELITGSLLSGINEKTSNKKWILAPLVIAAVMFITGTIGGLFYQSKTEAKIVNQGQLYVKLLSFPDSNLIYMDYRNNWQSHITVASSENIRPEEEGISGLTVSVYNQTDKGIDEVHVKIDFITSNGKTYKSENISVINIEPNSSKSLLVPDSEKGRSIKMEIVYIRAKSFHFCYSKGLVSKNSSDPYYCK